MARGRRTGYKVTDCPACGSQIFLRRRPNRGQLVTCRECDSLLEVTETSPLELDWAFEEPLFQSSRRRDDDYDEDDWSAGEYDFDYFDDVDHNHRQSYGNGRQY